jgi:hypothetical protein
VAAKAPPDERSASVAVDPFELTVEDVPDPEHVGGIGVKDGPVPGVKAPQVALRWSNQGSIPADEQPGPVCRQHCVARMELAMSENHPGERGPGLHHQAVVAVQQSPDWRRVLPDHKGNGMWATGPGLGSGLRAHSNSVLDGHSAETRKELSVDLGVVRSLGGHVPPRRRWPRPGRLARLHRSSRTRPSGCGAGLYTPVNLSADPA